MTQREFLKTARLLELLATNNIIKDKKKVLKAIVYDNTKAKVYKEAEGVISVAKDFTKKAKKVLKETYPEITKDDLLLSNLNLLAEKYDDIYRLVRIFYHNAFLANVRNTVEDFNSNYAKWVQTEANNIKIKYIDQF